MEQAVLDDILNFLVKVIAYGGTSAFVAFSIFKHLGTKWIDNKFSNRLQDHKHDQDKELHRLRVEIDSLLNGALKLQEKEFEVLPEAWQKLDHAYGVLAHFVSPAQEYADVDRMTTIELDEFLAKTDFEESAKNNIRRASKKLPVYQECLFWKRVNSVRTACRDFHIYFIHNSIFLPLNIKEAFTEISDLLWSSIVDKEVGHEADDWKMQNEGWTKVKEQIDPLKKSIEGLIRDRLHGHGSSRR